MNICSNDKQAIDGDLGLELLDGMLGCSRDAVLVSDDSEHLRLFNQALSELTGKSSQELQGTTVSKLFHYKNDGKLDDSSSVTSSQIDGPQGLIPVEIYQTSLTTAGRGQWSIFVLHDLRKRHNLETRMHQAERLQAIGSLAAGIAHEINSPSQFVTDNISFLQENYSTLLKLLNDAATLLPQLLVAPEQTAMHKQLCLEFETSDLPFLTTEIPVAINDSREGIERITKIVKAMKAFAHPGSTEKSTAALNKNIQDTVTVCRNEWKYVADMQLNLAADLPLVPCLVAEINQVILNLITNAAHSIGDVVAKQPGSKGLITITTSCDQESVSITVSDTGTGIPEQYMGRIFDPFFTTKQAGQGSGQGLAIAKSVIEEKHCGELTVQSEAGKGSCFCIRLPLNCGKKEKT